MLARAATRQASSASSTTCTLLIPDRRGNNRVDTFGNILAAPGIGLIFMVPGINETLQINGRASVTRDPALLGASTVQERPPLTGLLVAVDEAFFHCGKALIRSKLWDPATQIERNGFLRSAASSPSRPRRSRSPRPKRIWKRPIGRGCIAFDGAARIAGKTRRSLRSWSGVAMDWCLQAAHDAPIPYIQRIRDYYRALGYGAPYEWAHYADVPFQPLREAARAMPRRASSPLLRRISPTRAIRDSARAPLTRRRNSTRSIPATRRSTDLRISHVAIDRTPYDGRGSRSYFPLPELQPRSGTGPDRIGRRRVSMVCPPTASHRTTLDIDCPEIVERCLADSVDAAILVPQLPGLPSERQPDTRACWRRAASCDRGDGLAPRTSSNMSACRACCSRISRSAIAAGRPGPSAQASTLELALAVAWRQRWSHARPCGRRWRGAQRRLEARLSEPRPLYLPRRSRAADAEFDKQKAVAKALREGLDSSASPKRPARDAGCSGGSSRHSPQILPQLLVHDVHPVAHAIRDDRIVEVVERRVQAD